MAGRSPRRPDTAALVLIVALTGLLASVWAGRIIWTPDAVFYQARVLEIRGDSEHQALDKVWSGPSALGAGALTPDQRADPRWVPYSARFYRRRIAVPLAAAAVYGLLGTDSLPFIAILGCFAIGPLLYVLLRRRFSPPASLIAVMLCLAWPPLRWGFMPLTDSWGLALQIAGLLAAVLVMDGRTRWVVPWILIVLVGSFTRDNSFVLLSGVAALAVLHRSQASWRLLWTGLLAALPALLIFPEPLRERLAFGFSAFRVPADSSWDFVFDKYPDGVKSLVNQNLDYLGQANPPFIEGHGGLLLPLAILFGVAIGLLFALGRHDDDAFFTLTRASLLGGVVYLLVLPTFSLFRGELILLPPVAVGLAIGFETLRGSIAREGARRAGVTRSAGSRPT